MISSQGSSFRESAQMPRVAINSQKEIHKSQSTISILETTLLPGLAINVSPNSQRNSLSGFSFPKMPRFQSVDMSNQKENSFTDQVQLPDLRSKRTTSMGFGERSPFSSQFIVKNTLIPSPNQYNLSREFIDQSKHSFGLPHSVYQKVYLPNNKSISEHLAKEIPGPGNYGNPEPVRRKPRAHKMRSRGKMFNELDIKDYPAPNIYKPNYNLAERNRYQKISQGIGEKKSPFLPTSITPGPGSYKILSKFDLINMPQRIRRDFWTK